MTKDKSPGMMPVPVLPRTTPSHSVEKPQRRDGCAIINCVTRIQPDRMIAVNGDAVHAHRNLVGPIVEDRSFEGRFEDCIDDVMNIYNFPFLLTNIGGANRIAVEGRAVLEFMLSHLISHWHGSGDR